VYSDRTRGDLQVAKNNFFCSVDTKWGVPHHCYLSSSNKREIER